MKRIDLTYRLNPAMTVNNTRTVSPVRSASPVQGSGDNLFQQLYDEYSYEEEKLASAVEQARTAAELYQGYEDAYNQTEDAEDRAAIAPNLQNAAAQYNLAIAALNSQTAARNHYYELAKNAGAISGGALYDSAAGEIAIGDLKSAISREQEGQAALKTLQGYGNEVERTQKAFETAVNEYNTFAKFTTNEQELNAMKQKLTAAAFEYDQAVQQFNSGLEAGRQYGITGDTITQQIGDPFANASQSGVMVVRTPDGGAAMVETNKLKLQPASADNGPATADFAKGLQIRNTPQASSQPAASSGKQVSLAGGIGLMLGELGRRAVQDGWTAAEKNATDFISRADTVVYNVTGVNPGEGRKIIRQGFDDIIGNIETGVAVQAGVVALAGTRAANASENLAKNASIAFAQYNDDMKPEEQKELYAKKKDVLGFVADFSKPEAVRAEDNFNLLSGISDMQAKVGVSQLKTGAQLFKDTGFLGGGTMLLGGLSMVSAAETKAQRDRNYYGPIQITEGGIKYNRPSAYEIGGDILVGLGGGALLKGAGFTMTNPVKAVKDVFGKGGIRSAEGLLKSDAGDFLRTGGSILGGGARGTGVAVVSQSATKVVQAGSILGTSVLGSNVVKKASSVYDINKNKNGVGIFDGNELGFTFGGGFAEGNTTRVGNRNVDGNTTRIGNRTAFSEDFVSRDIFRGNNRDTEILRDVFGMGGRNIDVNKNRFGNPNRVVDNNIDLTRNRFDYDYVFETGLEYNNRNRMRKVKIPEIDWDEDTIEKPRKKSKKGRNNKFRETLRW